MRSATIEVNCGAAVPQEPPGIPLGQQEETLSELQQIIEANLPLIAVIFFLAIATVLVAAVLIHHFSPAGTARFNLPTLTLEKIRSAGGVSGFRFVVNVEPGRQQEWSVSHVRLPDRWSGSHLAKTAEPVQNIKKNHILAFEPGPWQQRLRFGPPATEGWVFLHSDVPDPSTILFTVSRSSSSSPRSLTIERSHSRSE